MSEFMQIDEQGYFVKDGEVLRNSEEGARLLAQLQRAENGSLCVFDGKTTRTVEAFDEALVASELRPPESGKSHWTLRAPYSWQEEFDIGTLKADEWDRFHGHTLRGLPFVLSRTAQEQLFNYCEEFDDESLTIGGRRIEVGAWLDDPIGVAAPDWWDQVYDSSEKPGFDLEQPSPALPAILARLKLPKARILVLGAGPCNDAFYLAEQGHLVTAVDFSDKGLAEARKRYGSQKNLQFEKQNLFALPAAFTGAFDVVFEHTCYCAVPPSRRNDLVKVWKKCLVDGGHLLGIFFAKDNPAEKPQGPPFGGSEWEVRERLKKHFQFIIWQRMRNSPAQRLGKEFLVYAQKDGASLRSPQSGRPS